MLNVEEKVFDYVLSKQDLQGLRVSEVEFPASAVEKLSRLLSDNSVPLTSLELMDTYDASRSDFGTVFASLKHNTTLTHLVWE